MTRNQKNDYFEKFFPLIINGSNDNRNFVKKAVNWALRSIGKKNKFLNKRALEVSNEILAIDCKSCKWINKNAIKELESEKVQKK